jgi:hypothetical protein
MRNRQITLATTEQMKDRLLVVGVPLSEKMEDHFDSHLHDLFGQLMSPEDVVAKVINAINAYIAIASDDSYQEGDPYQEFLRGVITPQLKQELCDAAFAYIRALVIDPKAQTNITNIFVVAYQSKFHEFRTALADQGRLA